jgi:MoxR-like ATPase
MINFKDVSITTNKVITEVERAIVGKSYLIKKIMAACLAGGHILLEDFPGLGKTILSKSISTALGLDFKRIQFTPDLLPGDITGSFIFNRTQNRFDLRKGPIFSNILLADEINRASPKTQSALLEAMQEFQVTLEGETLLLDQPFIVIATQNPIEYEGTFPLPEAQLDRFLVKFAVGYPDVDQEQEILRNRRQRGHDEVVINPVTDAEAFLQMRQSIEKVYVEPDIERYIVHIVGATREEKRILVGASPRASLALLKISRAFAAIEGREYVIPDDIKGFILPALTHRIILQPEFWMKHKAEENILQNIIDSVPVPVFEYS